MPRHPTPPPPGHDFDRRLLAVPLGVLALALLAAWSLAGGGSPEAEAEGDGATVSALTGDPGAWIGREVTVVGTVEERYPSRSFALGNFATVDDVIVVTRGAAHEAAREDRPQGLVEVTGKVRALEPGDEEIVGGDMAVRRGSPVVVAWDVPVRPAEPAADR